MISKLSRAGLPALYAILTLGLMMVALVGSTIAGPLEDGVAAFNRGDFATAMRILRPLAEQGNATAQSKLGFMHELGLGVPENNPEAIKWHRMAANQGEVRAQVALGRIYDSGQGVPQNYSEAAKWFRKAADQGDATGQFNLGMMYGQGHGVPQNYAEARKWYLKAAEQGRVGAQFDLAVIYETGRGVAQDYAEAMKWYRRAADQGDARALLMVGAMYDRGHGVPQSDGEALQWYRRAADRGHATAQLFLGDMYASGKGTPPNYILANLWLNRAAVSAPSGEVHDQAVRILGLIARKMTPAQIAGAQTLWRQCIASDYKDCVPAMPSSPQVASDRAGNAKRCLQIQGDEVDRTAKCFVEEYERLGHNQTESASVVADAIVGRCRASDAARMTEKYFPLCGGLGVAPADYDKAMAPYFARLREAILSQIVEERTPLPQPRSPPSEVARPGDKTASTQTVQNEVVWTGTGFFVSERGHIVTNAHVVEGCQTVRVSSGGALQRVFIDGESDLALYIAPEKPAAYARLRGGRGARAGEPVVAVGFPLSGLLSADPIVTTGIISALAGVKNDRRRIQITAPLQPGNSGGPLLGENGSVVGVVVESLDALKLAEVIGDIPQNVNFAVSAGTLQSFLNARGVPYTLDDSKATKTPADIAAEATHYTVLLECLAGADQLAATPARADSRSAPPAPPTARQASPSAASGTPPAATPQRR